MQRKPIFSTTSQIDNSIRDRASVVRMLYKKLLNKSRYDFKSKRSRQALKRFSNYLGSVNE
jgi:hypothetical protein